jgi:diacylglycerol kinase family enzyme
MAGCGFDADVVERLHRERRGHIHHWSYVKPILDSIRTYAYPRLQVRLVDLQGQPREVECRWAFVVNVPRYACGLEICPDALPNDGLLNVVTFKEGSLLAGLRYLSGILVGSHLAWDDVTCSQAAQVRIEAEYPAPYQLDGDPGGLLPAEFRCLPGRLRVIVSPQWLAEKTAATAASA